MKFVAHAGYREDNGKLATSELTDETDLAPTMRMWDSGVRLRPDNPFEYYTLETMRPVHEVAQGLTKVLCILIGAGLTREQLNALEKGAPQGFRLL